MKKMKKILIINICIILSLVFSFYSVNAQMIEDDTIGETSGVFAATAGYGEATIGMIMATVIKAFLAFLGIIFIILIIYGGFRWMTARGNEQQVTEAKDSLKRAVIGLVIIMAAYAITFFVFEAINQVSGPSGPGSEPL